MSLLDKLKEYLDTDDGKKAFNDFFNAEYIKEKRLQKQCERFREYIEKNDNFEEILNKISTKYNSSEYRERWFKRGIEPPEYLYYFLYQYADNFGREATEEEYEKYNSGFMEIILFLDGYYFQKVYGQGTIINIFKK